MDIHFGKKVLQSWQAIPIQKTGIYANEGIMQVHGWIATEFRQLLLLGSLFAFFGCSQGGQSVDATFGEGAYADLTGSITNEAGVGSSMAGWMLALIDKDTKGARVTSIDASGGYKFSHAFTSKTYTLQLLSPSSVFRASLAYPDDNDAKKLHPYFTLNGLVLPPLVSKGSAITMSSTDGITITSDTIADKNKDGIPDAVTNLCGPTFSTYIEWFTAKVSSELQLDGTTKNYITFYTKLRDNQDAPMTVQVIGANSLLNDAMIKGTTTTWDRLLLDNGVSEDGNRNDGLFSRKVLLGTGKLPVSNLMIFLQLTYGSKASHWAASFPYTFSGVKFGSIAASYEPITRTAEIAGTPFTGVTNYTWSISIFEVADDGSNSMVFTSPAVAGGTSTYVLPDNVLETGKNYIYTLTAQTPELVPGYPGYTIGTLPGTITP